VLPHIQNLKMAVDGSTEEIEFVREKARQGELVAAQ
jgi:hypothetical protein